MTSSRPLVVVWLAFLGALGMCAGLLVLAPTLIELGFYALILPGLVMSAIPTVFLYLAVGTACGLAVSLVAPRGAAVGAAIAGAAGFGFGLPWLANLGLGWTLAGWTAEDVPLVAVELAPTEAVVIRRERVARGQDPLDCEGLCLRLLYNRAAAEVFVAAPTGEGEDAPLRATRWRIVERVPCPAARLRASRSWSDETHDDGLIERVQARIAAGQCLVGEEATVPGEAWTVAVTAEAAPSGNRALRLFDRRVKVDRVAVRRPDGSLATQWTDTRAEPIAAPLTLAPLPPVNHPIVVGFGRRAVREHAWTDDPLAAFRVVFGDGARLPDGAGGAGPTDPATLRLLVEAALSDPAEQPAGFAVFERWVRALADQEPSAEDVRVLSAVIEDPRERRFGYLSRLLYAWGAAADPLAEPILRRMRTGAMPRDRGAIESLADAVGGLSEQAIRARGDDLLALARDPERRSPAADGLSRIAELGPSSKETLREMARAAVAGEKVDVDMQIAAMGGLCALGDAAAGAEAEAWAVVDDRIRQDWGTTALRGAVGVLHALGRASELEQRVRGTPIEREVTRHLRQIAEHPERRCLG